MKTSPSDTPKLITRLIRFTGRMSLRIFTILAIMYCGLIAMLMMSENSLVYPAPAFPVGDWDQQQVTVEDATFTAKDGTQLHGWFVEHPVPRGIVLYFHGNGENVGQQARLLRDLHDRFQLSVLAFDYRGYGKSEGEPFEKGIQLDSRAALNWLTERTGKSVDQIIFFGRSLGAAVAVELAEEESCKALILQSAFASMPDSAAHHYPWIPVGLLMRNRYPSQHRIRNCPQPLLQTHGTKDKVVVIASGKKLFDAATCSNKCFVELPGEGHNGYPTVQFWNAVQDFLDEVAPRTGEDETKSNNERKSISND